MAMELLEGVLDFKLADLFQDNIQTKQNQENFSLDFVFLNKIFLSIFKSKNIKVIL